MSSKRTPGRSLDEWMELVIQCRQSGLSDAAWCSEHRIFPAATTTSSSDHALIKRFLLGNVLYKNIFGYNTLHIFRQGSS